MSFEKIIVIGCSGAGKSTFSRALRDKTGLPLYHLDMLWHKPDKSTVTREEFDASLRDILALDKWIIDGTFSRTLNMRFEACDTVFFLDYPLEICISGVESRIGKPREDMPWSETEFDPEFRQWIEEFPANKLPEIYRLIEKYGNTKQIYIFKSRSDADEFLGGI